MYTDIYTHKYTHTYTHTHTVNLFVYNISLKNSVISKPIYINKLLVELTTPPLSQTFVFVNGLNICNSSIEFSLV